MKARGKLKRPEQVERVKFSSDKCGKPVRIGGYATGDIYLGRLRFIGRKWKRVAIKVFKTKLSDMEVDAYKTCVTRLSKAGVRLPKTGFVKMRTMRSPEGEFMQVSQLFGSTGGGSKIANKSEAIFETKKARREAAMELTKVANAGYRPFIDFVEPFKEAAKGAIPIDLDTTVKWQMSFGQAKTNEIANFLEHALSYIAGNAEPKEYKAVYDAAFKAASPEVRKALEKVSPAFDMM